MNTIAKPRVSIVRACVLPLFLLSGATGLVYEITWMRSLGSVFGNTVFAGSTVLTAFMLGLALGSILLGRIADRVRKPLMLYAGLELAIGLYAFAFPTILMVVDRFYLWFYPTVNPGFITLTLTRFTVSVLILLTPTILMGGTLPILSTLWTRSLESQRVKPKIGQSIGVLYGLNTLGAVVGSFLTGYFLIQFLGVTRSIYIAAGVNVLISLIGWVLSQWLEPRDIARAQTKKAKAKASQKTTVYSHSQQSAVLGAVFVAGFCALSLEVLWTRILVFVLQSSAYAFSCMLTCFILGLALGSLIASRVLVPRLKNPLFGLGVIDFLLALAVAGSIPLLSLLWRIDLQIIDYLAGLDKSFVMDIVAHFIDTLIVIFVPTLLMGMAFPLAIEVCSPAWQSVGRRVGQVYAWNTLGCVLGAFMAGFVFIPLFGMRNSFLGIIGILLLLAVCLIVLSSRKRIQWAVSTSVVATGLMVIACLGVPRDVFLRTMNTYYNPSEIIYMHDDATGTVTVHDLPDGDRLIAVDGVAVAGMDLMLRTTQKLQAYAPLLVHKNPQDVVQIGYGSGETCGIGLAFGVPRYTIVDVCPGIFTAGQFFKEINRGSYADPALRKVIMDGKNFIKLTHEKFDVIMNDSTYPSSTGSAALYTYDHFLACRQHLKPGGVLSCWVPLDLRPEDFRIIVRSFQAAMPHCALWMVNNCLNKHAVFLGTLEPTQLDFQRIQNLVRQTHIAADLEPISIHSAYDFLDCMAVGPEGMKKLGGQGPLHTDDHPHLEFGASVKRDIEGCWLAIMHGINRSHGPISPYVTNLPTPAEGQERPEAILQKYSLATQYTILGAIGMLEGNAQLMNRAFDRARKANPYDRDVESILLEMDGEIRVYEEQLDKAPEKLDLRPRLAKRYMLLEQYDRAAQQYEQFLAVKSKNAAAWNQIGICYQQTSRLNQADQAFRLAIQHNPDLLAARTNLANLHKKPNQGTDAETSRTDKSR